VSGVTQARLANEGPGGDCLRAAFATAMGLPAEYVPDFILFGDCWPAAVDLWLRSRGFSVVSGATDAPPDRTCVVHGLGPRGISHACAWVNGELWDPHPSRNGLVSIRGYWAWDEDPDLDYLRGDHDA
jgi:hypothetical protein